LITRPRRFGKTINLDMLCRFLRQPASDKEDPFAGLAISPSTIFNIYGKWGAGKTTFVEMMIKELGKLQDGPKQWRAVRFNAWQSQHVEPVWWSLVDKLSMSLIQSNDRTTSRWYMQIKEWYWRLRNGYGLVLILVALAVVFAGLLPQSNQPWVQSLQELIEASQAYIAGGSALIVFIQTILMGSASSARLFQATQRDPMLRVREHFMRVLQLYPDTPILVFVDDLDRCNSAYVVRLLECMQTLLSHKQLFYVVAADRKWISSSFDQVYEEIKDERPGAGSRGYHFVEKIFQLSIGLPAITGPLRERLVRYLVSGKTALDKAEEREDVRNALREATSEEDLTRYSEELKNAGVDDALVDEEATIISATPALSTSREHRLTRFTSLFEPNARSVKLVVNAYGVYINLFRTSETLELNTERLDQIALWSILNVRFPHAAELIESDPTTIERVRSSQFASEDEEKAMAHPDIRLVLDGGDIKDVPSLDTLSLSQMLGRRTP
ncbi:MAG: P-loop NTPase fold protein, partial [Pseudomonadota bacterium]